MLTGVCVVFCLFFTRVNAQTDTAQPLRIAVLAPLYIDSVFTDEDYIGGNILPGYMLPGLDFYNGVMMAVDSLQKENMPVEVWVYDTKKKFENTDMLKVDMEDRGFSLIIAYVSNAVEQQQLSGFAFSHNIPFISGTYPNDAGITGNPYFAIVNPTLKTHTQAIYRYVVGNYAGDKVYYVTKAGGMEQKIKTYFDAVKASSYTLKYTPINLTDNFTADDLLRNIDTTEESVIICASLDAGFGFNVLKAINTSRLAKLVTVVGMPTWDDMPALYNEDCKNVNIVFSTPYSYNRHDKLLTNISQAYRVKYKGRPTDMAFKGFEQMYHFSHLLVKYHDSLFYHLSDASFKISNDYNFQPVRLTTTSYAPDYLENKKLYFIKMLGGSEVKEHAPIP